MDVRSVGLRPAIVVQIYRLEGFADAADQSLETYPGFCRNDLGHWLEPEDCSDSLDRLFSYLLRAFFRYEIAF